MNPSEKEFDLIGHLSDDCSTIKLHHAVMLKRVLKSMVDVTLDIVIRPRREKRSDSQNRYCWGVIVPMVRGWLKETQGEKFTADEVYTWLRIELLGNKPKVVTIMGQEVVLMTGKRMSLMNTKEFAEAVDTIRAEMLNRGLDIPEPTTNNDLHEFLS